ncbi:hypothetical protein GCK72_003343 [Caenorhabditis remanei]|uniref:Uncharacterized protein n=1 Tax=Caenorhabditis remanei TaxID=31234 RepID=A0A6A5HX23_CAERE|nr:hypothetical protein GCK72_003343 [Caenorhabditis remanei]KAF1771516.1 hypothetical protein GCK72_003343 [Caenorhabditis remanei]
MSMNFVAIIEHLAFLLVSVTCFAISLCGQRVPSTRERSSRRGPDDSASSSQKQTSQVETEKEAAKRSEYSHKSQRNETMDSIRIMRGKKNQRKQKDPKELKPDRSDSQHTEIINVPLGKAAKDAPSPSKEEKGTENRARVQFAEKLVKSSKTPTQSSPAAPQKPKEPEMSKKIEKIEEIVQRRVLQEE